MQLVHPSSSNPFAGRPSSQFVQDDNSDLCPRILANQIAAQEEVSKMLLLKRRSTSLSSSTNLPLQAASPQTAKKLGPQRSVQDPALLVASKLKEEPHHSVAPMSDSGFLSSVTPLKREFGSCSPNLEGVHYGDHEIPLKKRRSAQRIGGIEDDAKFFGLGGFQRSSPFAETSVEGDLPLDFSLPKLKRGLCAGVNGRTDAHSTDKGNSRKPPSNHSPHQTPSPADAQSSSAMSTPVPLPVQCETKPEPRIPPDTSFGMPKLVPSEYDPAEHLGSMLPLISSSLQSLGVGLAVPPSWPLLHPASSTAVPDWLNALEPPPSSQPTNGFHSSFVTSILLNQLLLNLNTINSTTNGGPMTGIHPQPNPLCALLPSSATSSSNPAHHPPQPNLGYGGNPLVPASPGSPIVASTGPSSPSPPQLVIDCLPTTSKKSQPNSSETGPNLHGGSAGGVPKMYPSPSNRKIIKSSSKTGQKSTKTKIEHFVESRLASDFRKDRQFSPSASLSPTDSCQTACAAGEAAAADLNCSLSYSRRNYKSLTRERRMEANARERTRVHTIGAAFDHLRRLVPAHSEEQKLSKLSILRIASKYILLLAAMNGMDYSEDNSNYSVAECMELLSDTLMQETKAKK